MGPDGENLVKFKCLAEMTKKHVTALCVLSMQQRFFCVYNVYIDLSS